LTNGGNSFTGLTVAAGTVLTAADSTLGSGSITINPAGTLTYTATTTTARTVNNFSGVLSVAAGATLTLNGAAVYGGFLHGGGSVVVTGGSSLAGVTTGPSTPLTATGVASFANFVNGGPLTIDVPTGGTLPSVALNLFTNQGSGSITITGKTAVGVTDFQSYGSLTLANGVGGSSLMTNYGSTPLYFNGGSRTSIGTIGGNGNAQLELNGQNAIVAGGLLVNNGSVTDNSAAGTSTIIADYGALVKGAGSYDNPVLTRNGGRFQTGNSPGRATFGSFVFGPGGVDSYVFAIDDATGQAGPSPDALGHVSGWGLVKTGQWQRAAGMTTGNFTWTATPAGKLTVALQTLVNPTTVGQDVAGPMADFDPSQPYVWPVVEWTGTYTGPTDAAALDAATDAGGFANPVAGTFGWQLDPAGQSLSLTYTPTAVPEPGTLALVGLALSGVAWRRTRRAADVRGNPV
jgi:hypothetical protein